MARREAKTRRRLGRGLDSLISTPVAVEPPPADEPRPAGLLEVPLGDIRPNPRQPRQQFDDRRLQELANSIREAGLMQPVLLRPSAEGGFELIAGERRWRAAQMIGLPTVPALVRDVDDQQTAEMALIENLQREDLNAMDRAEAFRSLMDDFELNHAQIAERVGLDRSSVSNLIRLNELDGSTKQLVREGRLALGHARCLLGVEDVPARRKLGNEAVAEGWSVRELERRARASVEAESISPPGTRKGAAPKGDSLARAHLDDLERRLGDHLGTKVVIKTGREKGKGQILIDFYNLDQFEGLMEQMGFRSE